MGCLLSQLSRFALFASDNYNELRYLGEQNSPNIIPCEWVKALMAKRITAANAVKVCQILRRKEERKAKRKRNDLPTKKHLPRIGEIRKNCNFAALIQFNHILNSYER